MLLAQIKVGNDSYKTKKKPDKYYIFCISIIKSAKNTLQQFNEVAITMEGIIKENKLVIITEQNAI